MWRIFLTSSDMAWPVDGQGASWVVQGARGERSYTNAFEEAAAAAPAVRLSASNWAPTHLATARSARGTIHR